VLALLGAEAALEDGAAVYDANGRELGRLVCQAEASPGHWALAVLPADLNPETGLVAGPPLRPLLLQDGLARGGNREAPINDLLAGDVLVEEAEIKGGKTAESHFSAGFGAHFCEVAVHRWTGEVRLRRMHGTFAMGRVLNEKTARSQAVGGMIWGVGTALHEDMAHDPRTGHVVTRDLANYHIAAHADIPRDMKAVFLEERDDYANPLQSKGVGELGISGSAGAVLNAIHNACGVRIRDLPATPDRVIAALEAAGR